MLNYKKMKKTLFIFVLISITCTPTFAQLKLNDSGNTGLGITPRNDYKLTIKGNLLITTYPDIPPSLPRYTEFRIKLGNGWPGCEIGTPTKKIVVWASEVGYNDLYAANYYTASDRRLKTNLSSIKNGLQIIRQIEPYSYYQRDTLGGIASTHKQYGFVAQDIAQIIPEITDSAKDGIILINYQQIIPFLVSAIKEQQIIIDSLNNNNQLKSKTSSNEEDIIINLIKEINEIKTQLATCCISNQNQSSLNSKQNFHSGYILKQNKPNPFSENTIIEFEIAESFSTASITIFDMQGTLKKTIPILNKGNGQITINGFELTAGMYLYSLIVDNKEIDTKKMILIN